MCSHPLYAHAHARARAYTLYIRLSSSYLSYLLTPLFYPAYALILSCLRPYFVLLTPLFFPLFTSPPLGMFNTLGLLVRFGIPERNFLGFMRSVRAKYHPNPFHNYYHAVSVLHATFLLLGTTRAGEMLTHRDMLGALIASYGHDIDHPGHSNSFEVASMSRLAIEYSDDAVRIQ